jgi:hypothetical protein
MEHDAREAQLLADDVVDCASSAFMLLRLHLVKPAKLLDANM